MGFFDKKPVEPVKVKEEKKTETKSFRDTSVRPRRDSECYIAEGIKIEGKVTGTRSVGIDGVFDGIVDISSKLIIGETGKVTGEIKADDVLISGKVNGDISVKNLLEIKPTGQIFGDITAQRLVIEDGVLFEGNITMSKSKAATKPAGQKPVNEQNDGPTPPETTQTIDNKPEPEENNTPEDPFSKK